MMKLSAKEAAVLSAVELRTHAPMRVLQKDSGLREHTIRYSIRRLEERKVIFPIPLVNLHRLGFMVFNVFFSLTAQRKEGREGVFRFFRECPDVVWIGDFGGEFQYGIAIATKSSGRVLDLLTQVAAKYPQAFFEKEISLQSSCTIFPRRYLSSRKLSVKPLRVEYTREVADSDPLDDKLLTTMASFGGSSHRQIAQKLGMPASTVDLRVKRLEEKKVITGYIYAVDPTQFEVQQFKLLVYAKGMNPALSKALQEFCESKTNVPYLIECLGSWDYELGVEVKKAEEVTEFVQEIYERFGALINTVRILTKFRDIKIRWYPGA